MEQAKMDDLKRAYNGPMSHEEIAVLRDMQAFIEFSIRNGLGFFQVLSTLAHDVNGLLRQDPGLLPKVTHYSELIDQLDRQLAEMAEDPEVQSEM